MDDIFLNAEFLLCCCACCETYGEPNNNNHNNYSNRENLLIPIRNEELQNKNQYIKRDQIITNYIIYKYANAWVPAESAFDDKS